MSSKADEAVEVLQTRRKSADTANELVGGSLPSMPLFAALTTSTRIQHSAAFKANVALAAICDH